jgi:hypothetical protein
MDLQTWLVYLLATTGLSLSPGPNSLLALTHGALHGWRRTLFTIAGGAVDTNGDVTLTSTNQYYFVETDGIVGRIRMRAPESYK